MPKRIVLCVALILLLPAALNAQEEKKAKKILKNADIVLMTENHFDDDAVIKVIEVSDTDFDTDSDDLVELMRKGVSTKVCRAMLASARKKRLASQAQKPEPSSPPTPAPTNSAPEQPAAAPPSATPSTANSDPNFATRPADPASAAG